MKELLQSFWEKFKAFWKRTHLTKILLLIFLTMILIMIVFFAVMAKTANVQTLKKGLSQATVIYDKDGDVAGKVSTNRTEGISVKNLPDHVKDAVIAVEDHRFYEHNGFSIKGISRAFFNNFFAGEITGGGSTLTQQLTKNALLSPEQTYKRKIEELFLAVEIEKNYSKDEILEMYLNQVYFGSGAWGIDQASKKYFNKNIKDVSISEAALLAGLLQAPSAYDPYQNYDRAMERRDVVLGQMKKFGKISDEEYKKAVKEKIELEDGGGSYIKREYPYYTDAVLDEAINKYGLTQDEILTRGYRIYTEMDQNLQSSLEKVYKNDYLFPNSVDSELVQSGSVLLDPESGGVRALVGGRGDQVFRGFNRATHIKAQPGSTMKPLAVYTPALEEGYTFTSMLKDEEMSFGKYKPENSSKSHSESGEVPMYKAVEESLNVPAVWLLDEIGLNKGIASLKKFGIPLEKEDHYLGIALGGMHKGISPFQLAEAYSAFANDGKRNDGHLIQKIVGPTGNIIAERKEKTTKVTSKKVARDMTSMLLDVVENGTGKATNIPDVQIAGKTGSTQLPYNDINGTKDQWFVGYTSNLVGAVWLGYDKTDRQHYLSTSSSQTVVPIFRAIMEQSLKYVEPQPFDVQSASKRLNEKEEGKQEREEGINEKKEQVKKTAKEIGGYIKEESPKWKKKIDEGIDATIILAKRVKDKFNEVFGE
ncbi:transglycosylase domain-containing protein [Bacillus massilinigeriensis]|uniref:transglycosylase domain-containing protein n=1 Tax=Bacillus massilionigeriensis TaxID=1805475 RepID=UPI00096AE944|nr:PBP1A family penicillin-binding protein [Bacillus massilionigeriensis]